VELAYTLQTLGGAAHMAQANVELTKAFQLSDRLPERELYNVQGAYYTFVKRDRPRAIEAFRRAVKVDSANVDAANSLAVTLSSTRDRPGAVQMYKLALANDSADGTILNNLAGEYLSMGRYRETDSVLALFASRHVPFPVGPLRFGELWAQTKYDSAEKLARGMADSADAVHAARALQALASIVQLRGRLREADRLSTQADAALARSNVHAADPYATVFSRAMVDGAIRGSASHGIAELDSTFRAYPVASAPVAMLRNVPLAIEAYAHLGSAAKARDELREYEARLDSASRRQAAVAIERDRGAIAMTEGKADSAVAFFRQSDVEADGLPTNNCPPCTSYLIGIAYDQARQADSARKYLTEYVDTNNPSHLNSDPHYLALTLFRLGELYQDAGDAKSAISYYSRFVDLWKNADPDLQPRVAEARKRIAQLAHANG
jgi:tetratricopeptide (TPR) repeat protein